MDQVLLARPTPKVREVRGLRELNPETRGVQDRFENYCKEQSSLIAALKRHEAGELHMSPEKKENRETRLTDLVERLIPKTVRILSNIQI